MKLADLYSEVILWTCYIENYPDPKRFLNLFGLTPADRLLYDHLGSCFPFEEFYVRGLRDDIPGAIGDLRNSRRSLIVPWVYWPRSSRDSLNGKLLVCPSSRLFNLLDNKVETKKLFRKLGLPTPDWNFVSDGETKIEKPFQHGGGGLDIRLTRENPKAGCFLEEYYPHHRSIGLQFFVYDETEFVCADEMLYGHGENRTFVFHSQRNVDLADLEPAMVKDCYVVVDHLSELGYRGFVGIDALIKDGDYSFLEVNPRGIAFLPAFFAATSRGWTSFTAYSKDGPADPDELVLIDFGAFRKVVRKTGAQ